MNGAALGQTATSTCYDIYIFPKALCVPAHVRKHLWDIVWASILRGKLCQTQPNLELINNFSSDPRRVCSNCLPLQEVEQQT